MWVPKFMLKRDVVSRERVRSLCLTVIGVWCKKPNRIGCLVLQKLTRLEEERVGDGRIRGHKR